MVDLHLPDVGRYRFQRDLRLGFGDEWNGEPWRDGEPDARLGSELRDLERSGGTECLVGALERADVDLAVSITGIAGPGGATPGKPVGLVHFAVAARDGRILHREQRFGAIGRSVVRARAVVEALRMLMELARGPQQVKPKRAAVSRIRPRVTRTPRRHAVKRRRPPRG